MKNRILLNIKFEEILQEMADNAMKLNNPNKDIISAINTLFKGNIIKDSEQESFDITVDDVISIKIALSKLGISSRHESNDLSCSQIVTMIRQVVNRVINGIYEQWVPKYETPEQFKQRTGKEFPDDGPVWRQEILKDNKGKYVVYHLTTWKNYKPYASPEILEKWLNIHQPAIATEAGKPPDDWKPDCNCVYPDKCFCDKDGEKR